MHARPGDARALDGRKTDAAASEHRDDGARFNFRRIQRRADASGHATADERRTVERHIVANFDERVGVHKHLLGIRPKVGHLRDRLTLPASVCGGRVLASDRPRRHEIRAAGEAVVAAAAKRRTCDHVIDRV